MKRNCRYFRYVHKVYFLKIKEVLVLFDKISSFQLRNDHPIYVFVGRYYQRRVYTIWVSTSSPYTHANSVHVRECARYESQRPQYHHFLHSSAILIGQSFYFVPRAIRVDFRVFLDVTQHLQLYIRTFCDSRYALFGHVLTN